MSSTVEIQKSLYPAQPRLLPYPISDEVCATAGYFNIAYYLHTHLSYQQLWEK